MINLPRALAARNQQSMPKGGASNRPPGGKNRRSRQDYNKRHPAVGRMGHMFTCPCSWTLITQEGEEDLKMHIKIHMTDAHPGAAMNDEDIGKAIRTV